MKIIFVRHEDYWIFPVTLVAVILTEAFLYVGSSSLKFVSGLLGISGLMFITYIINKNYSRRSAIRYLTICIATIILTVGLLYYLTK